MKSKIDRLLREGKEDEALPLIAACWEKDKAKQEAQTEKKIADFTRRLDEFEKRQQSRPDNS